ncbi:MAG: cupredoxin domain-containing protein, partial [Thermomicrobiales bacterium]
MIADPLAEATVVKFPDKFGGMAAAPAGMMSHDQMAMQAPAEIRQFVYRPSPLQAPVGSTVTWTNGDSAPHTVTQDGGGFQSGKIATGATFSFKFDKAGIYAYHCEYHANMKATIVVK